MKTFSYKITDPVGIHARPAGLLIKKCSEYKSEITLTKGANTAERVPTTILTMPSFTRLYSSLRSPADSAL